MKLNINAVPHAEAATGAAHLMEGFYIFTVQSRFETRIRHWASVRLSLSKPINCKRIEVCFDRLSLTVVLVFRDALKRIT